MFEEKKLSDESIAQVNGGCDELLDDEPDDEAMVTCPECSTTFNRFTAESRSVSISLDGNLYQIEIKCPVCKRFTVHCG